MNLRSFESMTPDQGPTISELAQIRPGTFVRLSLNNGARFWAMCTSRKRPNGTYLGRAETSCPGGPHRGDQVIFEKRHIYEVV